MQVNAAGDLCAICQEKMHASILLVNTFSAKTMSQSGGFIIACSFHFP